MAWGILHNTEIDVDITFKLTHSHRKFTTVMQTGDKIKFGTNSNSSLSYASFLCRI